MQIPEIDFSDLELRDIGTWPPILRFAIIAAAGILSIVAAYFVIIESHIEALNLQETQLVAKRQEFQQKYNMAVNLDAYKQQMVEMRGMYQEYLKALPSSSEISSLIDNISTQGEKNNLKFTSIKIGEAKVASGFYMELPIDLVITGTYSNIGMFMSDLSKLSRIVTVEDFSIKPATSEEATSNPGRLSMNLSTKIYWVASTNEQQSSPGNSGKPTNGAVPPASPTPTPPSNAIPGSPLDPMHNPGGE